MTGPLKKKKSRKKKKMMSNFFCHDDSRCASINIVGHGILSSGVAVLFSPKSVLRRGLELPKIEG